MLLSRDFSTSPSRSIAAHCPSHGVAIVAVLAEENFSGGLLVSGAVKRLRLLVAALFFLKKKGIRGSIACCDRLPCDSIAQLNLSSDSAAERHRYSRSRRPL